ncbi:hypothetical protein [Bacillus toyonensis]|uniref:hypothetical protein n=1 Tax=Bacillus toyonensis TaxID=155322 RepID=UPI000BF54140|nr:hypothetical protein [Bacillus toyonensis]PGF05175.1 hypothetical protein COM61_01770 [Bacillus toyonensis]
MKGANEKYDLITSATQEGVGELEKLKLKYGWGGGDSKAYLHGNLIFVKATHGRGKTFRIFITEDPTQSHEQIKETALEVYGVTGGQLGWTETYGWIHEGAWVDAIEQYFATLSNTLHLLKETRKKEKEEKNVEDHVVLKGRLTNLSEKFSQV